MYKNFYLQASQMADMIRSGEYKKFRQAKRAESGRMRQGLVSRREQAMEESGPAFDPIEMASTYISEIRSDVPSPMMPEEEPISTRALTTDTGEPASIWEIGPEESFKGSSKLSDEAFEGIDYFKELEDFDIEGTIRREAELRNIDPDIAVRVWSSEGKGTYQSQVPREGKGSFNGFEASWGPFQLYTGGGLGNDYEKLTGRTLQNDNTPEGITTQIRFALDKAAEKGWSPWYGSKKVDVDARDGLSDAKPIGNWKEEE